MIRTFAKAAVLLSAVALLAGCEETKPSTGDAEAPKATASAAPAATTVTTATATTTAAPATDAGAVEPKDAGHDSGAKAAPKK